ncbi:MAG TPA: IS110 family transposase [Solimonas sp.]|nr:IS110 family transposase [Solimonas sp.]
MESTLIAVDTAKLVFEIAEAGSAGKVQRRLRLSRQQFSEYVATRQQAEFVLEACGGAHHWARMMQSCGHRVRLLPVPYVCAYRRRNKTDRADCLAMLEAAKNPEILPVPVKTVEHQAIQGLHRCRSAWMETRTARINTLRGLLREFGVILPVGATTALQRIPEALAGDSVPPRLRPALQALLDEIGELQGRIASVERQLESVSRENPVIEHLRDISGIGLLTATALYASANDAQHYRSGRHLASWLGLTPREHSSGNVRRLGSISKRGDRYVRMLLTHGARSVLLRAGQTQRAGQELNALQRWVLALKERVGHNKATCALANKLARIAWATWRHGTVFDPNQAAALPA